MGAILAVLLPLIPSLVQGVEKIFVKSKSGTDKMDAVVQALRAVLDKIKATGAVPPETPTPGVPPVVAPTLTDDMLRGAVEAVVQQLKTSGQLTAGPSVGSLYLLQGSVIPLKAT